jgi:aspartate aminotransferase-like enzyme
MFALSTTVSYKLFIPGPTEVSPAMFAAMSKPMFGHRSKDFVALYQGLQPDLQSLFYTRDPVYISTSSSWGLMEGAIRNLVAKRVLNCMNGAFSDKWNDVAKRCGKDATPLQFDWGKPVDPVALRRELATGQYDAVTLIHNETSTGTMSPLADLMAVAREFPEVISVVDCVSSFTVVPIKKDELGIDVLLTGSQKALSLPPGLSLCAVSERARQRAASIPGRGYYFDFLEFHANHEKGMTPSTPCISLINGLRAKVDEIKAEGPDNRFARHARTNALVHAWIERHGFKLLPEKPFASKSLSCIVNTRNLDLDALNKNLKSRYQAVIDTGYGKLKGKTFRISNMGDETEATISQLLGQLDTLIAELPKT